MRKIEYTFITLARQFLFISIFLFILLHLIVVIQILIYKIDKYYDAFNFPLTFIIYFIVFALLIGLFFQHRLFNITYTKSGITYNNLLTRKCKSIDFAAVSNVVCDTFGAHFYKSCSNSNNKRETDFYLPFFRGGRIDVVEFNQLLMYMQSLNINVSKTYTIMPGYGKKTKFLSLVYGFIALGIIANCANPLYTVVILFSNH